MSAIGAPRPCLLVFAIVATLVTAVAASATTRIVPSPATPTIASALAAAADGDSIDVLPGTYYEHGLLIDRTVTLRGTGGAAATIIDAQGLDRIFEIDRFDVVLEGLTIAHGAASQGAAIFAWAAGLAVRGCLFTENHAIGSGGAVYWGMGLGKPPLSILESTFSHNTAGSGGALFTDQVELSLTGCLFRDNTAGYGGAAYIGYSSGSVVDCLFIENSATSEGGGIYFLGGVSTQGCTFHANAAPLAGAIAGVRDPVVRTIIAATSTQPGRAPVTCWYSLPSFSCCDVFGNSGGNALCGTDAGGNFSLDPLFCDAAGGDFRLNENSPCLPGHHPGGVDCGGTIGALGVGCGVGTGVNGGAEAAPWSRVKARYR